MNQVVLNFSDWEMSMLEQAAKHAHVDLQTWIHATLREEYACLVRTGYVDEHEVVATHAHRMAAANGHRTVEEFIGEVNDTLIQMRVYEPSRNGKEVQNVG